MSEHWVFAYGSNMHLPDLRRWLGERGFGDLWLLEHRRAMLPDHRLVWNYYSPVRKGAAANVEHAPGHDLHGLALKVCDRLLGAIDVKEGHPERYNRGDTPVPTRLLTENGVRMDTSWLYVVRPKYLVEEFVPPRAHYLGLMVEAAREHGLPEDYVAGLENVRTKG